MGKPELVWELLGSDDPGLALGAVGVLVEQFDDYHSLLTEEVDLLCDEVNPQRINRLVEDLKSDSYQTRLDAFEQLQEIRPMAERLLVLALESTTSAEVRFRIRKIMSKPIERPKMSADQFRRLIRLIFALELQGGEFAREMVRKLAHRHNHIDISRVAAHALERMTR